MSVHSCKEQGMNQLERPQKICKVHGGRIISKAKRKLEEQSRGGTHMIVCIQEISLWKEI